MLNRFRRIHFVGIGGIGMSGLAKVLFELGYEVSGSDKVDNFYIHKLREIGIRVFIGHKKTNIEDDVRLVIYSSSISFDNPELTSAKERGIPILHRSEVLSFLFQSRIGIAVAGAHGKTTVSALLTHLLCEANFSPTAIVGGWINQYDTNAWLGRGNFLVAESDESDGSFTRLSPVYSIVNNVDFEHLDYYKNDINKIVKAYELFISRTRDMGCVFYCYDDPYLRKIMNRVPLRSISYGFSRESDVYPSNIVLNANQVEFECIYLGNNVGSFNLQVPGRHNVLNAQVAIAFGRELNISWDKIKHALSSYEGTRRRFQIRKYEPVMVVDDYAHHPNEIKATLEAACTFKKNRIITVFQPHRYTRIFYLRDKFADAFTLADKLLVTDIYSADEKPIKGVNGCMLYEEIVKKVGNAKDILFLKREKIIPYLLNTVKKDDLVLILGAGDITKVTDELLRRLDIRC
ncbi:MAG: UDP-N-acetylmuramate--L-alanine ligase [Candidatus Omnitrophica bacterium]|nr:UDP-N-acetylmuramate--L-alanine ligase [Candidatus Omnitrophota bacterium]